MLVGWCQWWGREFEPRRGQNGDTDYCPAQGPAASAAAVAAALAAAVAAALKLPVEALGSGAANTVRSKKEQLGCLLQQ